MSLLTSSTKERTAALALWCVPLAALAIVFRNILFSGHLFFNGDSLLQFYQYFVLLDRGAPWLVKEILGGFPLYASVNGMWFYPVNRWLLAAFDAFSAYHVLFVLDMLLAYVCAYGAARALSLRRETSVTVGLVFLFSGQLMLWATVIQNTNYYFLLPAAVWILEAGKRWKHRSLSYALCGALLGVGWLSGHVQLIAYIHLFVAAYLLFRAVRPVSAVRTGFALLLTMGISAGIGLIQNLPILKLAPYTARAHGVGLQVFFAESYGVQDLIHYFLPFWDNPVVSASVPNLYLGILPFLLLVGAFLIPYKLRGSACNFFLAVFVLCLVAAFKYSPLAFLLYYLPFFDSFRQLPRAMLIGNFAAALVVGFVIDHLHDHWDLIGHRFKKYLVLLRRLAFYGVLPLTILVTLLYQFSRSRLTELLISRFREYGYADTAGLPFEHYARIIEQSVHDSLYQLSLFDPAVITAFIMLALSLILLRMWHRLGRTAAQALAIVLIAVNAVAVYGGSFQTLPRTALADTPRTVETIRSYADTEPFRVYSLFTGVTEFAGITVGCPQATPADRLDFQKEFLVPNLNVLWELDSIDGYENFMTARVSEVLAYLGSERATAGELLVEEHIPLEDRAKKLVERKSLLEALNVRYVLSPVPLEAQGITELYADSVSACRIPLFLYRLDNVWPRYFLTQSVRTVPIDAGRSFADVREELLDSTDAGSILIESDAEANAAEGERVPVLPRVSDTERIFSIQQEQPSFLYVGEAWLPGWQVSIDNNPAELVHANFAAMGVWVPAGSHEVRFRYNVSPLEW